MSFSLDFLNEIKIEEVSKSSTRAAKKSSTDNNPASTFMGIRVWKSGKVYPSQALTDAFSLEYSNKVRTIDAEGKITTSVPNEGKTNGFDVFSISDWTQVDDATRSNKLILIGVTPKSCNKVDLFSTTKYNEDGTPVFSVMEQGASTFGSKTLLPLIKEVYGMECNEEGYIDLEINTNFNLKSKALNGIFVLPKVISRGDDMGKPDIARRENINVFPMTPVVAVVPPGSDFDVDQARVAPPVQEFHETSISEMPMMSLDLSNQS